MNADISKCIIEENGSYKYIQIECINKKDKNDKKIIIRGDGDCSFHKDIFRKFLVGILNNKDLNENYDFECIGGGKIDFTPSKICIYGMSSAYGQADHKITKDIVQNFYPLYDVQILDE